MAEHCRLQPVDDVILIIAVESSKIKKLMGGYFT